MAEEARGTERYQHNHRNWVPDACERKIVCGGSVAHCRGEGEDREFRKEKNFDNYCFDEERY